MANRSCLRSLALQLFYTSLKHHIPAPSFTNSLFYYSTSPHINIHTRSFQGSHLNAFSFPSPLKFSTSTEEIHVDELEEISECESTDHENVESIKVSGNVVNSTGREKKPLDALFREAVGLTDNCGDSDGESKGETCVSESKEIQELKKKVGTLEREIQNLRLEKKNRDGIKVASDAKSSGVKLNNLVSLFSGTPKMAISSTLPSGTKNGAKSLKSKDFKEEDDASPKELASLFSGTPKMAISSTLPSGTKNGATSLKSKDFKEEDDASPKELASLFSGTPKKALRSTLPSGTKNGAKSLKSKNFKEEDDDSPKELAPELVSFITHLHDDGYLQNANFLRQGKLVLEHLNNSYAMDFVRSAAEKFGQDHQEIAKWLSASDAKRIALFGCPSVDRGSAFAAKSLRSFFNVQEDVVCRACTLKSSCKFVNKKFGRNEKLILADVMRVVTTYAFDRMPQKLVISDEVKLSVHKLLKEVINLTQ